ncbi:DUF427 domain-containing protein [Amycolatopsis sp. NPDC005232]|uniref:DUF427 domain-containing protein n=1 Tax=Amycolatopsis sp. NPDC005232 TaxID=3157027 RepID=UPI0033BC998C
MRFGSTWVADSESAVVVHMPERPPTAYFPLSDVKIECLELRPRVTSHVDLGDTGWYAVHVADRTYEQAAFHHFRPPPHAAEFAELVGFSRNFADSVYEESEHVLPGASDPYGRVDVRHSSRTISVAANGTVVAVSQRPVVVYETGQAPRWCLPRADVDVKLLAESCGADASSVRGAVTYFDVNGVPGAARSWCDRTIGADLVEFDPANVTVELDGVRLREAWVADRSTTKPDWPLACN